MFYTKYIIFILAALLLGTNVQAKSKKTPAISKKLLKSKKDKKKKKRKLASEETKKEANAQFEIKNYRFGKHKALDFERLVIEFSAFKPKKKGSEPKLEKSGEGSKAFNITLNQIELVGAIPESSINDRYIKRSQYLGALRIDTDDPSTGTVLRIALKRSYAQLDAFWLKKPSRLVLDVYPSNAPRAQGRETVEAHRTKPKAKRTSASLGASKAGPAGLIAKRLIPPPAPIPKKSLKPGEQFDRVLCFPASTQLVATIAFNPIIEGNVATVEEANKPPAPEQIVCYPFSAQMVASIGFKAQGATVLPPPPRAAAPPPPAAAPPPPAPAQRRPQAGFGAPLGGRPPLGAPPRGFGAPPGGRPPLGAPPPGGGFPRPGARPPGPGGGFPPRGPASLPRGPGGAPPRLGGPPGLPGRPGLPGARPLGRPAPPKGSYSGVTPLGALLPSKGAPKPPPAANPSTLLPPLN